MPKTGRNQPCPCGSGRKFKHCCGKTDHVTSFKDLNPDKQDSEIFNAYRHLVENWDSDEPPPTFKEMLGKPNAATGLSKKLSEIIEERNISSEGELKEFLENYRVQSNNSSVDDFLGITPSQMQKIIYSPFTEDNDLFSMQADLSADDMKHIPALFQVYKFLSLIKEGEPIKATQKGNLPRYIVKELYSSAYKDNEIIDIEPYKEDDCLILSAHRFILTNAGLIQNVKNKFSLTKKAHKIMEENDYSALFKIFFLTYINKFNWAFLDRYDEFELIQSSSIFGLYIVKMKAYKLYTSGTELGRTLLKAFPDLVDEIDYSFFTPDEEVINCFVLRFIIRFCIHFGLLESQVKGEIYDYSRHLYRTTNIFDRLFKWKAGF